MRVLDHSSFCRRMKLKYNALMIAEGIFFLVELGESLYFNNHDMSITYSGVRKLVIPYIRKSF